ncbi:MAG: hypothetical protein R6W48_08620, partial [Gaiellaceae bacterium]
QATRPRFGGSGGRGYHPAAVPKHRLTELATGERVTTEKLPGVRSVSLGPGSAPARAGVRYCGRR